MGSCLEWALCAADAHICPSFDYMGHMWTCAAYRLLFCVAGGQGVRPGFKAHVFLTVLLSFLT
jgi:hypothetical protein